MASFQDELLAIIQENKRRRPQIAADATKLLGEFRAYNDQKAISKTFDVTKEQLHALNEKVIDFLDEIRKIQLKELEEIVAKIMQHLEAPVPSWDNLNEAMKLATGRGYENAYFQSLLISRPDDYEAKINMAEKIEAFAAAIKIKK